MILALLIVGAVAAFAAVAAELSGRVRGEAACARLVDRRPDSPSVAAVLRDGAKVEPVLDLTDQPLTRLRQEIR